MLRHNVRSREVAFMTHVAKDDCETQLRVTKGKTFNTRGGVKEETDHRFLEHWRSTAPPGAS